MLNIEALFHAQLSHHSPWIIAGSFLGGVVSSVLPCTVSMLPIVVGYIGASQVPNRLRVLVQTGLFVLGIATVMTALGLAAGVFGLTFGSLIGPWFFYTMGTLTIIFGLQLLGVLHIPIPQMVQKMPSGNYGRILTPFVLGLAFGATSSPCGTPFLTGILGMISYQQNVLLGGLSLFAYALGQGMILLVAGLFTGVLKHMARIRRVGGVLNMMSGVVFVLVGLMLVLQGFGVLADVLLTLHLL